MATSIFMSSVNLATSSIAPHMAAFHNTENPRTERRARCETSLQLTAASGSTDYQFWGLSVKSSKRSRPSAAAQRANYHVYKRPSIYYDLEHYAVLRSEGIGCVPPPGRPRLGVNVKQKKILESHRQYQLKCQQIGNTVMDRKMSVGRTISINHDTAGR